MRDNFQLMRTLAKHTRLPPDARVEKLLSFNRKLRQESKVVKEFQDWNMTLDKNLLEVPARILPSEKLIFGRNVIINSGQGEWSKDMQKAPLWQSEELRNWVIIGCERDRRSIEVSNNLY